MVMFICYDFQSVATIDYIKIEGKCVSAPNIVIVERIVFIIDTHVGVHPL